jgi:UDP-N-acetyl-D-glucosamine dehydrogenase
LTATQQDAAPGVSAARSPQVASVAVVGLGYVGLPTALALADGGVTTVGIDINEARLQAIRERQVDLVPADRERLERLQQSICVTNEPAMAAVADAVIVCVPTPVDAHRSPDLRPLQSAAASVVRHARPGQTLILTSTTYVGSTNDLLVRPLEDRGLVVGRDICVAFSPERIDPANSSFSQDRVPRVVGGVTERCTQSAASVLETIAPVHAVSSPEAAEMTKLHENIFRAVNIALANELADAARHLALDPAEIIEAASTKPYGFMRFMPGAGVGGHCIPCDPHYLLWQLRAERVTAPVVSTAMTVIEGRPAQVVARAADALATVGRVLAGARVLVVGAAYKPGVEDTRESPAIEVLDQLAARGATVAYHDPLVASIRVPNTGTLRSVGSPLDESWDLAITLTLQPGHDYFWLAELPLVLDTTYRLGDLTNAVPL